MRDESFEILIEHLAGDDRYGTVQFGRGLQAVDQLPEDDGPPTITKQVEGVRHRALADELDLVSMVGGSRFGHGLSLFCSTITVAVIRA